MSCFSKLRHFLALTALWLVGATPVLSAATSVTITVTSDRVALRARGNIDSEIVHQVSTDTRLTAHGDLTGTWLAVTPPDEVNLWVYGELIRNGMAISRAQVRSGPGISYRDVGRLEEGDPVIVRGAYKEWLKIAPPAGALLWIARKYVQSPDLPAPVAPTAPVPPPPTIPAPDAGEPQPTMPLPPVVTPPPTPEPIVAAPVPAPPVTPTPVVPEPAPVSPPVPPTPPPAPIEPAVQDAPPTQTVSTLAPTPVQPTTTAPAPMPSPPPKAPVSPTPAPVDLPPPPTPDEHRGPQPPETGQPVVLRDLDDEAAAVALVPKNAIAGEVVQREGMLQPAGLVWRRPSPYRLVSRDDRGRGITLCFLNMVDPQRLPELVGRRLSVTGREYTIQGVRQPLVIAEEVRLLP